MKVFMLIKIHILTYKKKRIILTSEFIEFKDCFLLIKTTCTRKRNIKLYSIYVDVFLS